MRLHKETNSDTIAPPPPSSVPLKRDPNIWYPYSLDQSDLSKTSHMSYNANATCSTNITRNYESDDRSHVTTMPSASSPSTKPMQSSSSVLSSCRYYPTPGTTVDKPPDIYSAYGASIVSDAVSPQQRSSLNQLNHHASHIHHQYQQQQQQSLGSASISHTQAHHSPVNSYSMLQNMSYENARCALPSPTIFPPTPPPSAPWNPWAGF